MKGSPYKAGSLPSQARPSAQVPGSSAGLTSCARGVCHASLRPAFHPGLCTRGVRRCCQFGGPRGHWARRFLVTLPRFAALGGGGGGTLTVLMQEMRSTLTLRAALCRGKGCKCGGDTHLPFEQELTQDDNRQGRFSV